MQALGAPLGSERAKRGANTDPEMCNTVTTNAMDQGTRNAVADKRTTDSHLWMSPTLNAVSSSPSHTWGPRESTVTIGCCKSWPKENTPWERRQRKSRLGDGTSWIGLTHCHCQPVVCKLRRTKSVQRRKNLQVSRCSRPGPWQFECKDCAFHDRGHCLPCVSKLV